MKMCKEVGGGVLPTFSGSFKQVIDFSIFLSNSSCPSYECYCRCVIQVDQRRCEIVLRVKFDQRGLPQEDAHHA